MGGGIQKWIQNFENLNRGRVYYSFITNLIFTQQRTLLHLRIN